MKMPDECSNCDYVKACYWEESWPLCIRNPKSNLNLVGQLAKRLKVIDKNITIIFMPNQEVQISEDDNIPTNYDFSDASDKEEK